MRYFVFIFLLSQFFSTKAFCQDPLGWHKSFEVYVMPFSMIPHTPRIRAGAEYNYKKFGYSLDVGVGKYSIFERKLEPLTWTPDYTFIELRPEFKYFVKHNQEIHTYVAGEWYTMHVHDNLEKGYFLSPGASTYYETASVNRWVNGFNFKGGHQMIAANKILIDMYYGLGFFFDRIYYTDVLETDQEYDTNFVDSGSLFWYWFSNERKYKEQAGRTRFRFNITLGMKLGLIFWGKDEKQ